MWTLNPAVWQNLILAGKVIGALSTFCGVGYALLCWLGAIFERKLKGLNGNVELLMTNHLPHVQKGIDEMHSSINDFKVGMARVEATVEGMGTRLDEGKEEIRALGTAFTQHLQFHQAASTPISGVSSEVPAASRPRRSRKKTEPASIAH